MEKGYYIQLETETVPQLLSQSTIKMEKGYYVNLRLGTSAVVVDGRNPQ